MSRVPPPPLAGKDLRAVPAPEPEELEQLEELGDDAIIAQQQGAHIPKPRAQVTEEARSVVISDHPLQGSRPPPSRGRYCANAGDPLAEVAISRHAAWLLAWRSASGIDASVSRNWRRMTAFALLMLFITSA